MNEDFASLIYSLQDEDVNINVIVKDDTIWLSQKAMAELFDVGTPAINKHLKNIFKERELSETATISKMEIVQNEGRRKVARNIEFYNLDAIISVGYGVNDEYKKLGAKTLTQVEKDYLNELKRIERLAGRKGEEYE